MQPGIVTASFSLGAGDVNLEEGDLVIILNARSSHDPWILVRTADVNLLPYLLCAGFRGHDGFCAA